jgi:hypothetical protein
MSWFTLFTTTKTTSTATAAIKEQPVDSKKHIATAQKRTEKTKNPAVYSTKSTCTITKPTLVNVTIDATRDEFTACRALSIELAKRSSRSPCTSRRSSQTFHSETSRRSLSLLYSASPPPKATVSLLSTSVSVTGASTEHKSTATAFESLSTLKDELLLDNDNGTDKADNDDKNDQQEELQKPQQKHDADIVSPSTMSIRGQEEKRWSWFRFSSYTSSLSNLSHQQSKTEVNLGKQQLTDSPKAMSLADQPSASTSASTAMTHKEKHSLLSKGIAQQEQSDKSLATCSSASSLKKKRNNIVLPTFETEFVAKTTHDDDNNDDNDAPAPLATKERAHIETKKPHFIIRAIEAINSVLIEPPPSRQTKSTPAVDFDWLAKQMHTKFARFVEEIKSSDHTKKHNWVDKRITIIGTHGWFPMKVKCIYTIYYMSRILILYTIAGP